MTELPPLESEMVQAAIQARQKAYAPYSKFLVGAALRTADGNLFCGANVENASYGLTMCAERVAVGAAVSAGHRGFSTMAIASQGGASPCGACRQVLAQFGTDLDLLLIDVDHPNRVRRSTLLSLLPDTFTLDASPSRRRRK